MGEYAGAGFFVSAALWSAAVAVPKRLCPGRMTPLFHESYSLRMQRFFIKTGFKRRFL